jgi:hypothetical protein
MTLNAGDTWAYMKSSLLGNRIYRLDRRLSSKIPCTHRF